jgi:tetratricopeptide (TPR) repeat protein
MVDRCLDAVARSRVNILITARPTFQHGFGGHPIVTKLALNKLGRDQVVAVVQRLTGGKSFPDELLNIITDKTDGVPLFVEEMTKTILESGDLIETANSYKLARPLNRLVIPTTLYDSLMARLDRLQPVKEVAQTAACIGRDFDYQLLKSIVSLDHSALQDALERLAAAELIFRRGSPPDATYLFKHALVRDAAYENLLKTRRRTIHGKLLEVLQRDGAVPELLARHAAAAGMDETAVRHWLAAGEIAASRSANKEAATHLRAGIELLSRSATRSDDRLDLKLHSALISVLMVTQGYGSDEVGQLSARTVELARRLDDEATLIAVLWQAWLFNYTRANHTRSMELARELNTRCHETADMESRIVAHVPLGCTLFSIGRLDDALAEMKDAIELYAQVKGRTVAYLYGMEIGVPAYGYSAWSLAALGREGEAVAMLDELLQVLSGLDHPFSLARGFNYCAAASLVLKDWQKAKLHAKRALDISLQHEQRFAATLSEAMYEVAQSYLGEGPQSLQKANHAIAACQQTGARTQIPFLFSQVAQAAMKLGDLSIARKAISQGIELVDQTGERQVAPALLKMRDVAGEVVK